MTYVGFMTFRLCLCGGFLPPATMLADLYAPLTMPPALVKAHQKLDAAVDTAYGKKSFKNDAERVAFLFDLYQQYTTLLPGAAKPKRVRKSRYTLLK